MMYVICVEKNIHVFHLVIRELCFMSFHILLVGVTSSGVFIAVME